MECWMSDEGVTDSGIRRLVEQMAAQAELHDRHASFPSGLLAAFAATGLAGLTVPRCLGGGGQGIRAAVDLLGRLAAAEPSSTLILAMTLIQQATIARSPRVAKAMAERIGRLGAGG